MQNNIYGAELDLKIDKFKSKMKEAQNISKETGKKIADNTKYGVWKDGIYTLSNGMQFVKKEEKQLNNEIEKTGKVTLNTGNEISKAFNKGLKSVKRLTVGFLGARTAFGLFKKYMGQYSNENDVFAEKMRLTSSVIANTLAPAFEFFGNVIQYAVIGLARIIELLTGVNILGKTVDNSLKGASKSAKELNDNLSGLDEISNIDKEAGGLSTGISSQLEAINDFKKKIEEVKELFKKWGIEDKIKKLREFLKALWNSQVIQWIRDAIGVIVDYGIKHPNIVATILGGMALVNLISKIMGTAGMGGTGLLGLVANLKFLSTLGVIAITIAIAYEIKKKIKDFIDDKQSETDEILDEIDKKIGYGKEEMERIINEKDYDTAQALFDKKLESFDNSMKNITKLRDIIDNDWFELNTKILGGQEEVDKYNEQLKRATEDTKYYLEQFRELYQNGLLSSEQMNDYKKLIGLQLNFAKAIGYSKDELNDLITEYLELNNSPETLYKMIQYMKLMGYSEDEAREKLIPYYEELLKGPERTSEAMKQTQATFDSFFGKNYKLNIKTDDSAIDSTKTKIDNTFKNPVKIKFTAVASGALSKMAGLAGNVLKDLGIGSYDVGTDYVPRDQIAMIHEGERIIPKKYNNSNFLNNEETNSLLIELNKNVLELANKPSILNVNGRELAKATYSDFKDEESRRGNNISVRRV